MSGLKIKKIGLKRLTLGAHLTFHRMANQTVEPLTAPYEALAPLLEAHKAVLEKESLIVNRPKAFVETAPLRQSDYRRDRLAGCLMSVTRAHLSNPIAERKKAAETLSSLLASYRGITTNGFYSSQVAYKNLVSLLREEPAAKCVDTLGLRPEVDALDEENQRFQAIIDRKVHSVSERLAIKDINTLETRAEADRLFREIARYLEAYAVVSPAPGLKEAIESLNGLVLMYKQIIANQGKKRGEKKEEDKAEKPDGEKEISNNNIK